MTKKILVVLLTVLGSKSISQINTYQWGVSTAQNEKCLELDHAGNTISMGQLSSGSGLHLTKRNASGVSVWSFSLATVTPIEMKLDSVGNSYLFGTNTTTQTIDLDPSAATFTISFPGHLLVKYDSNGNLQWGFVLTFTNAVVSNNTQHLAVDKFGNSYVCGLFQTIAQTVDFDPGPGVNNITNSSGSFLAKYNTNGGLVFAKTIGGAGCGATIYGVEVNQNKEIYLMARSASCSLDFDLGPGTTNLIGYYIAKYDSSVNTNLITTKDVGVLGTTGGETAIDKMGNFYFAFRAQSVSITNWNFGNVSTSTGAGGSSAILVKFAASNLLDLYVLSLVPLNTSYNVAVGDLTVDDNLNAYVAVSSLCSQGQFMRVPKISSSGSLVFNLNLTSGADCTWPKLEGVATNGSEIYINSSNNGQTADYDPSASAVILPTVSIYGVVAKYNSCTSSPIQPGTISGSVSICNGSVASTYSTASIPGAASYSWSLPGGWTGTSTTNIISTTVGLSGGNLSVTASNACGTSSAQTLSVTISSSPTITVNSGTICSGKSFTMVPNGASTYTFQGGNAIVSPTSSSSYTVIGSNTLGCNSNMVTSNVTVSPSPTVMAVSSASLLCAGQSATLTASGASTYTWNPGGSGSSIVVSPTTTSTYSLTGVDANGCQNTSSFTQSVSACTEINHITQINSDIVEVYPNPTTGKLTVLINPKGIVPEIYNSLGQKVSFPITFSEGEFTFDMTNEPSGIYLVKVGNTHRKIIKQ